MFRTTSTCSPAPVPLSARILGIAALVAAIAGCGGGSSGPSASQSNATDQGDKLAGHYTGTGAYVTAISFDVNSDASSLTHFHGFITASCYTGGSLYSGQNQTVYNQYTMDDPESVDVGDSNDFSSTYSLGDKASFTFKGELDGKGGATGTVSYKNGACASIVAPWSASLSGVKRPPLPGASPSAQAENCDPQSCATIAPLTLTVTGFHTATWPGHGDTPMLELDFTLASSAPDAMDFGDRVWIDDGSHEPIGPGLGIDSLALSSGDVVQCDHGARVPAGQTLTLHWCYAQGDLDTSQSLSVDWDTVRGTKHIPLSAPD